MRRQGVGVGGLCVFTHQIVCLDGPSEQQTHTLWAMSCRILNNTLKTDNRRVLVSVETSVVEMKAWKWKYWLLWLYKDKIQGNTEACPQMVAVFAASNLKETLANRSYFVFLGQSRIIMTSRRPPWQMAEAMWRWSSYVLMSSLHSCSVREGRKQKQRSPQCHQNRVNWGFENDV